MTQPNLEQSKIAFTTLGCRVNQYDTQVLKERLEEASFLSVPFHDRADVYVINTCTVTAAADAEGRLLVRRAKAQNPESFVVVTGCLATDRPEEVASLPGVDLVVSNSDKASLLYKIRQAKPGFGGVGLNVIGSKDPWGGGITRFDGHQRATVKVQDGCHFGCSFCLIPRVRGEMVSRPQEEILAEGRRLAERGVKELVLAGIQLSSYGRDWGMKTSEPRLAPVIQNLLKIPGIRRVRLSSYAVADFEDALLPLWKDESGLCPHLHLPLQSGDEGILKAMRRPYTLERYQQTLEKARRAAPQLGLTGDILAGFPGETEEAFQNTLHAIEVMDYIDFHPFPYSDRPDTPGEGLTPKVDSKTLHDRMGRLKTLKNQCLEKAARKALEKEVRVIAERYDDQNFSGLTDQGLRVVFAKSADWLGKEVRLRVTGFGEGAAFGEKI
jgi:threonylcarbamoyladenosine tRNA methylthiotransferase MtaB